jgi:phage/plasmid-like protein (TIGR03299 family)
MPANIEKFYGLYTPAWHGVGFVADTVMSLDEALLAADMDFEFSKEPVYTTVMNVDGVATVEIEDKFAVLRRNRATNEYRAYGPVGNRFTTHTLQELWAFAEEFLGEGAVIDTIGTLGKGERAFMTMILPVDLTLDNGDKTNLLLTATTGFDGSTSTSYGMSGIRVVCANTWKLHEDTASSIVRFRHTSSLAGNELRAAEALNVAVQYRDALAQKAKNLLAVSLRAEDAAQVLSVLFPFPEGVDLTQPWDTFPQGVKNRITRAQNKRARVFSLYENSPARAEEGTGWGLYNAVTEYADHFAFATKDADAKADKVLAGELDSLKDRAADLILAGI